ncbi:MAG TPA: hypothetical protein VK935_09980 [Actinomycetospora sp.]|nr:hypothetical protein [Actinomycetospora sp.]
MDSGGSRPSASSRTLRLALIVLVASALLTAAIEVVLLIGSREAPYGLLVLLPLTGLVYVGVGAVAWARRPSNRTGALLVVGGLVWLVAGLVNTLVPLLIAAGQLVAWVPVAVIVHATLAFPSGRLAGAGSRALAAAAYLVALLPQPVRYAATPNPPP